jgi:hypothetical protein
MAKEMAPTTEIYCPVHPTSRLFHSSGWWRCTQDGCKKRIARAGLDNTNRARGEDRGYDASGEAHGMKAKGSKGGSIKRR